MPVSASKPMPATIRHNNPSAMYPGASARQFGSSQWGIIGGKHQVATFPDSISGAAAQFHLLNRSYCGMTVKAALEKWSGGNNVAGYCKIIKQYTGLKADDILTKKYIQTPETGIAFAKAQARHETGKEYPLSTEDWVKAHAMAFPVIDKKIDPVVAKDPYALAKTFIGTKEFKGARADNPVILRWYEDAGWPQEHDETPNCSAFVCSMLHRTAHFNPKTLLAKDHLKFHEPVELKDAKIGDIVVMDRPGSKKSWEGHIGFLAKPIEPDAKRFVMLGANQGDATNETSYPVSLIKGIRRPLPAKAPVMATIMASKTLKSQINAVGATIAGILLAIYNAFMGLFTTVPGAVETAESTVSIGMRLAALFNLAWPVMLTSSIAIGILGYTFMRGLGERRVAAKKKA